MPLRNRVDPFGAIHAVDARGMFTGNRGVIHDPASHTLLKRRWTTRAWIICACDFKGRRRRVMGRNAPSGNAGWTELFFLDEVTALAAGHRPCFYCRRQTAVRFMQACADGLGLAMPKAQEIDARLHDERLASGGVARALTPAELDDLPDGTMVAADARPFALGRGRALPWSFEGYGAAVAVGSLCNRQLTQITPATTVSALRAGFEPVWRSGG